MTTSKRLLIFLAALLSTALSLYAQEGNLPQDKEQSKIFMDQAVEILAATKVIDQAREMYVLAANYDTTNVKANFEAGHYQVESIGKDLAAKYFLRAYRQNPNYRFDLLYWIAKSYHYGKKFDKAIQYYNQYKEKLKSKPGYAGKDKFSMAEVDRRILECNNGKEFVANPQPYSIVNIGSAINSAEEDYGPVITADESQMYFTTRRQADNTFADVADDNKYYEDVFYSTHEGSNWKSAKNISAPVNSNYNESTLAISPDGSKLFIFRDENGGDIYVSEKGKDGKWGEPTPLPGTINSSYRESSITISADEKTLYFASDRPGGYGGSDIYLCTKDSKGEWSRVKNLGPMINTELDEDGPFISFDSKTLYFSSEEHKGMGGFDIFKTHQTNAETNEWSEPENIGYPINSPDDDIFYVISKDGQRSYFATVRDDGFGYTDIYVITKVEDVPKTQPQPEVAKPKEPEKQPEKQPEPVIAKNESVKTPVVEQPKVEPPKVEPKKVEPKKEPVKEQPKKQEPKVEPKKEIVPIKYVLTVIDAATRQPLDTKVSMVGLKDKLIVGSVDQSVGVTEYTIKSTVAKEYKITVEKDGYIFQTVNVKVPAATAQEKTITKTIEMRKLTVNAVSILHNIYFDFEKATFRTESYGELNRLETMMKQSPNLQIEIAGHADFVGSKDFNKRLSLKRANAVRGYLTSKGIDPRRVKTVGYGEERPIASNDDEKEGRELNRRVEFKVIGK